MKESELIALCQKGNCTAYGELVKKYEKFVYNTAYGFVLNSDNAFDISQDTFIKAWRKISSFEGKSSFSTWLYRITVNTAKDFLSSTKNKTALLCDEEGKALDILDKETPESQYIKKETLTEIEKAVMALDEDLREVIILREVENLTYNEIALCLEIELGTAKSRLSRARQKLRTILREQNEEFFVK